MASEDAQAAYEIQIHNILHYGAITFLYWDHLITLDTEIKYCWNQPKSLSALLFFLNRYFAFLSNISITILANVNMKPDSCRKYNLYRQLLLLITQVFICFLLTLRIYALYGCDRRILRFMYAAGFVLASVAISSYFGQKASPSPLPGIGCHIALAPSTAVRIAAAWEALFVYDSLIFTLTCWKTHKARHHHELGRINIPIVSLILRDGAVYFAVMALSNLANILTFYFSGDYLRGGLSTFASSISVTMLSRLMLNLHQSADLGIFSTPSNSRNTATGEFSEGETVIELDTLHWTTEMGGESPTHLTHSEPCLSSDIENADHREVEIPRLPPPPRSHHPHPVPPSIMIHPSPSPGLHTANTNTSVTFVDTPSPKTFLETPTTAVQDETSHDDEHLNRRHSYA